MPPRMGKSNAVAQNILLDELLKFLSMECPALLPKAREMAKKNGGSPAKLARGLKTVLRKWADFPAGETGLELWPGTRTGDAAGWYRDYLEEILDGFFRRQEIRSSITPEEKIQMYKWMVLTRTLDSRLKELFDAKDVKWNEFPSPMKGFRSWGQEAISGLTLRLRRWKEFGEKSDWIGPVIRDVGVLLAWTDDVDNPLHAQAGKMGTPMDGRDLHIGDFSKGTLPPTAPLAISTQTLIGMAYSMKMDSDDRLCVGFIGEGGASLGEWHEAINFAAATRLNMIFVLQNNQWALGTHVSEQSAVKRFALRGPGYGIPGISVYGNDPEEVAAASAWAAERARAGKGPTLLEIVSYRRSGHAHHDDSRFHGMQHRPGYEFTEERERWASADPIENYELRLQAEGVLDDFDAIREEARKRVDGATDRMRKASWPTPEVTSEIFAPRTTAVVSVPDAPKREAGYDEAVRMAISEQMEADDSVWVIGEDVSGRYDGAFGVTRGLSRKFGELRCLNSPLSEGAIIGCSVGSALFGKKPVAEMQFADFLATAFNALVNNAAKIYWRYRRPVPMVVRLPYGGASKGSQVLLGGGPFHSQCPESWFVRTPGWKIVAPATPTDAKGLMAAAIRDPNPVIFLEAKGLYSFFSRDLREEVPLGADFEIPLGEAKVRHVGSDLTCVTYGPMVFAALEAAAELEREGVGMEVVDLRTLVPLDEAAILRSVEKTNRLMIVHEDSKRGGFGAEIAALVAEQNVWNLDAPIVRVAAPDTPVPYAPPLEHAHLPKTGDILLAARRLATL